MEDWSVLVCQHQPIRVPGNVCVRLDLDGPTSLLIWTNKKRDECLQLDSGKTVNEKFRCRGLSLVFRGTAQVLSPAKHVGLKQKVNYELDLQFSWTCWTGLLKHNALVNLYNCCLLPFPCFSFQSVKMRVFGLKVALRTDIHTEAGQSLSLQAVKVFKRSRPPCWRTYHLILGNLINILMLATVLV